MRKFIELSGDRSVVLECNAATPFIAKKLFGIDLLGFFQNVGNYEIGEQTEVMQKLAFTLAMQAEKPWKEVVNLTYDDFIDWLSGFEYIEMVDSILIHAVELWNGNGNTSSEPKN